MCSALGGLSFQCASTTIMDLRFWNCKYKHRHTARSSCMRLQKEGRGKKRLAQKACFQGKVGRRLAQKENEQGGYKAGDRPLSSARFPTDWAEDNSLQHFWTVVGCSVCVGSEPLLSSVDLRVEGLRLAKRLARALHRCMYFQGTPFQGTFASRRYVILQQQLIATAWIYHDGNIPYLRPSFSIKRRFLKWYVPRLDSRNLIAYSGFLSIRLHSQGKHKHIYIYIALICLLTRLHSQGINLSRFGWALTPPGAII